MSIKRLSALILVVFVLAAALSACNTVETETPTPTGSPEPPSTEEPTTEPEPEESTATKTPEYQIKIIGEVVNQVDFSITQMRGLGANDLLIEGTIYNGIRLIDIFTYAIPMPLATKVIITNNDGDTFELPLADVQACSDCFLVLTLDDHVELVMPGFDKEYWIVGVAIIEFAVDDTLVVEEQQPIEEEQDVDGSGHLFCQVTDIAGILDKSFNETAWNGILAAVEVFGVEGRYLESMEEADYEVNINVFLEENCDIIIPVGYSLESVTRDAVEANPNQHFALVDITLGDYPNITRGLYNLQDAKFLSGYLAAGMTETGIVGIYVGILTPATQAVVEGFDMGIAYYNEVHGTDVQLLGWDMETQQALEYGDLMSDDVGRRLGEILLDEGADIIMPVAAEPVCGGTLAVMAERDTGLLIGVDIDWSLAYPEWAEYVLASTTKNVDLFIYETITKELLGEFEPGDWIGTLENGGIGIQYGVDWIDQIPEDLKAETEDLIEKIITDEIITSPVRD
jgi:basic membrane protein A